MQNYSSVMKLGMVALLSAALVGCASKEKPAETKPAATPAPAAAAPAPARPTGPTAEQIRREKALAKTKFYFEFDKASLSQEDRDDLVFHAADLKSKPNAKIRLEGHADERGTREYNLALGERRAKTVYDYLLANGVSGSQMETVSYGEERPADTGKTEAAYQLNRRVELIKK